VQFQANGGQYLSITNIPIGPSNVVARILAFTGSNGSYFFYLPTVPTIQGQIVATATQINDNTTTTALLDFSDTTLYNALSIDTPGNTLSNQIVLDGALGFGFYGSRLVTYGQRNRIQNLLNLSFDGGYLPSASAIPSGWVFGGSATDTSTISQSSRFGFSWKIVCSSAAAGTYGLLSQSFFQDAYGAPIGQAKQTYSLRCWCVPSVISTATTLYVSITSSSTGFSSIASISASGLVPSGSWQTVNFSAAMPSVIPADLTLKVYATTTSALDVTFVVDEISIIYAQNPFLDTLAYASYVNNPEGFDGVTGKFGPTDDTKKIMDFVLLRDDLYFLTQDPSGRLHRTNDNGVTEPSGWTVHEVASNCGALSAFSTSKSQNDDQTGSGGEEFFVWASLSGPRICGGDQPWKIGQEIAPDWALLNPSGYKTIWCLNDNINRIIYFGLPLNLSITPSSVYTMSYRSLDTAYQISNSPPVRNSFSGRLLSTDNTRKWCPWSLALNCAALMLRPGNFQVVFGSGQPSFGNVYTLNSTLYTDDDYGQISSFYTTFFFVNHEAEIALQLGAHRKMIEYVRLSATGVGNLTLSVLRNNLANVYPFSMVRSLPAVSNFDLEWSGASAQAERMALKISSSPLTNQTDNSFSLTKLVLAMKPCEVIPVRGAAQ
jgi:hypothetical protein